MVDRLKILISNIDTSIKKFVSLSTIALLFLFELRINSNLFNEYLQKFILQSVDFVAKNLGKFNGEGRDVVISRWLCSTKETLSGIVPEPVYETEKVLTVKRTLNFGRPWI